MTFKFRAFDRMEDDPSKALYNWYELQLHEYSNRKNNIFNDGGLIVDMWTTRQDRNGEDIYHNDIVRVPANFSGDHWYEEVIGYVIWEDDGFCVYDPNEKHGIIWQDYNWSELEVIGNMHQHKHLVEPKTAPTNYQI